MFWFSSPWCRRWNTQFSFQDHMCVCVLSRFSCVQLCNPMNCSPSGSSVHGILQARILSGLPFPPPGKTIWSTPKCWPSFSSHWVHSRIWMHQVLLCCFSLWISSAWIASSSPSSSVPAHPSLSIPNATFPKKATLIFQVGKSLPLLVTHRALWRSVLLPCYH